MTMSDNPETQSMATSPEDADELKRKLIEMQRKLSTLENELNSLRKTKKKTSREAWVSRLILGIILFLAITPPALVVAHSWLYIFPGDWNRGIWCKVDFFCNTFFPSYFSVIIGCFLVLAVIMFYLGRKPVIVLENPLTLFENPEVSPNQIRIGYYLLVASGLGMAGVIIWSLISQQWPGWDLVIIWLVYLSGWALRAIPLTTLVDFWKRDGEFWISLLLMHIAIITVLAAYYDVTQIFYLSILLLVFAFGNLWRFRKRVPAIYWVVSITMVFYSININAWWTSVIGDDYGSHQWAWDFAEGFNFTQVGGYLFKSNYFASVVQGISMKLLGHDSFGWRFSSLYLSALGVALFYFFCKSFTSKKPALVAACLLAFSHYVMSFGKIGYAHLQGLFALSLVLAVATWALRWKQPFVFALLGSTLALCFYLFPASLYAIPAPLLLLLLYYPPVSRKAAIHWLVMITTWLAMLYPLSMQLGYWESLVPGTIFNRPELVQSPGVLFQHFIQNLFYSFFSFLYIAEGHYVAVSYIDPVTAVFITLGFFVLLYQIRHQKFAIFTALSYVIFLVAVGTSHDRENPTSTRMFMMLPWFSLIGMWGIIWVDEYLKKLEISETKIRFVVPVLLIVVAAANLTQAYKISYTRYSGFQSVETMFVGVTQTIHNIAGPNTPINFVVINGDVWGIDGLLEFQNVYPHLAWFHLYQIRIKEPVLPEDSMSILSDKDTVIMVSPYLDPELQKTIDAPLLALEKVHCDVFTANGQKRFALYYSPHLGDACLMP